MTEIIWTLAIVLAACICAVVLGKREQERSIEELVNSAILFGEECYIEGIIPIQRVKRMAEFYLVQESKQRIDWREAQERIEKELHRYDGEQEKEKE